jgi:hypothetical protein
MIGNWFKADLFLPCPHGRRPLDNLPGDRQHEDRSGHARGPRLRILLRGPWLQDKFLREGAMAAD